MPGTFLMVNGTLVAAHLATSADQQPDVDGLLSTIGVRLWPDSPAVRTAAVNLAVS